MWPFSTLRHLRWEIEQANTANEIMRTALTRRDERIAILDKQITHRDADVRDRDSRIVALNAKVFRSNELHQQTEGYRQRSENARITLQEQVEQHVRNEKDLNRVLGARDAMCKALAAERDEAVLRARKLAEQAVKHRASIMMLASEKNALRNQLSAALVRDPKTGRMTKWQEQPPGEAPFDFLGSGRTSEADDTVNFDRVMAGLHDAVRK